MSDKYLFTSESVTEGHPDKLCDAVSDAVLDAYLKQDPHARVACETIATTGMVAVMGEISSRSTIDVTNVVRETIRDIGYNDEKFGFNSEACAVILALDHQSSDIDIGVNRSLEAKEDCNYCEECIGYSDPEEYHKNLLGAGDQGMMFGYACNETDNFMPAPIFYAHKLCSRISYVRKSKILDFLGPDGKSMVTFEYIDEKPSRIDTILISAQHLNSISQSKIKEAIIETVINPVVPAHLLDKNTRILVNPTGRFVKGGPCADTGLTGRKIIVDTYGGIGRHGGGSFSGKDPTKVDRTGAYAARYIAKNIVASDIADKCEVQISYAIGVARPISIFVDTFGTAQCSDERLARMIPEIFDLRPASLIEQFKLRSPIYRQLAAYGHMGREDLCVAWEKTDKVKEIKEYLYANKN